MRVVSDALIAPTAVVSGDVILGKGCNIWYGSVIRGDLARITIGERVNIQDGCIVHTDFDEPQVIEAGVVAGHGAIMHGRRIGAGTMIAMGAKLLSRCVIGEECIIAAGALVTEDKVIPPRSLVVGTPGKVVRTVTDDEVRRTRSIADRYFELAHRYARGEVCLH